MYLWIVSKLLDSCIKLLRTLTLTCREWKLLKNLPKISVVDGSPLNRADLRAVKVNHCRNCIILSARAPDRLEPVLADKEIVMAALNIKSMSFNSDGSDTDLEQIEVTSFSQLRTN